MLSLKLQSQIFNGKNLSENITAHKVCPVQISRSRSALLDRSELVLSDRPGPDFSHPYWVVGHSRSEFPANTNSHPCEPTFCAIHTLPITTIPSKVLSCIRLTVAPRTGSCARRQRTHRVLQYLRCSQFSKPIKLYRASD